MGWKPIEEIPAVGKKRMIFKLANNKVVTGYKIANTKLVRPEFASDNYLAISGMGIPI